MQEIISLAIPFIAIAIFATMIDIITQAIEIATERVPKMPDYLGSFTTYLVVLIISFLICWQGRFDLFKYLAIEFQQPWQGWLFTALVISGGSSFVRKKFGLINDIPSGIYGIRTTFVNLFDSDVEKRDSKKDDDNVPTI